jgi:hypothetical protein
VRLARPVAALALLVLCLAPAAYGQALDGTRSSAAVATVPVQRISPADPLNGGFLIANQHGMLFHDLTADAREDIAYARWLGAGIIRVFGTDNNGYRDWDGRQVGARIADRAPLLRAANMRLIVAFVNNHRAVPGEAPGSSGWMDDYMQLLLPFYTSTWRGAYLQFVRDVITTVQARGALDVIYAWELGNELHTPRDPSALMPFITAAAAEVRALDQQTPLLPGTMGANHVDPGNRNSSIARWLYCEAPVDAYTLHAYDWVSRDRGGDMPIDWDLDNIVGQPCPDGRQLPVIVEELGTSRALPGLYSATDETLRLAQERHQIEFVRQFPQVVGFGVWNAESPRLADRTFVDNRRGLTSYGPGAQGGGSCYDPTPLTQPGVRCGLELLLRSGRFLRAGTSADWSPGPDVAAAGTALMGELSLPSDSQPTVTGWVLDPTAQASTGVDGVDVYLGQPESGRLLVQARTGIERPDLAVTRDHPQWAAPGFAFNLPPDGLPGGPTTLTLAARTEDRGTWYRSVQIVVPMLGDVQAPATPAVVAAEPTAVPPAAPASRFEVSAPEPGASVGRSFLVQGIVGAGFDRVDVFLEPGRDAGGPLVGTSQLAGSTFVVTTSVPRGAHTIFVHGHQTDGREIVLTIPIVAS